MNMDVVRNAVGALDRVLGKAKDALRQIEDEAYGYSEDIGYQDAKGALGFHLHELGHALLVVLEAAEMPKTRVLLRRAWATFKRQPKGLSHTISHAEYDHMESRALGYAERLIEGLRMSVSMELTTEESWRIRRLEAILYDTDALVHGRGVVPKNEKELRDVMHDYLQVCFPDFVRDPQISGSIKNFKPDCGIRGVTAAIEFKIVHNKEQVATAFSGVAEDTAGYRGSKEWKRFYAVFYQSEPFMRRSQVREDMKRIGASEWTPVIVHGKTGCTTKQHKVQPGDQS